MRLGLLVGGLLYRPARPWFKKKAGVSHKDEAAAAVAPGSLAVLWSLQRKRQ